MKVLLSFAAFMSLELILRYLVFSCNPGILYNKTRGKYLTLPKAFCVGVSEEILISLMPTGSRVKIETIFYRWGKVRDDFWSFAKGLE